MRRPNIKEKIPQHLHPFVATQDPALYTAIDHASWRYIMRVARAFFATRAHQKYLDGLSETGISVERIPLISEMDERLQAFGWRAVAVVGFIPPAVFMEFLSLGVLPIACDMRRIEHLSYTPAPDIVHEAAGHAPIIADQEYADYILQYGEVSSKVIFSSQDMDVYEAIRNLSDVKEDPASSEKQILAAQARLDGALASVEYVSEATELARMAWWTIEYGMVGDLNDAKIYGAGLLSSIAESYHCYNAEIKKLPLTIDCITMTYDITKPQPQLYVTPDFATLSKVLEQFAARLAFRKGGREGLEKAKRAGTTTTSVLDTGLQISGKLAEIIYQGENPIYLRFEGASQLSLHGHEIDGHGAKYHSAGFGTPVGKVKSRKKVAEETLIEFESGVTVRGKLQNIFAEGDKELILSFDQCTVRLGDRVLFDPAWGTFDMACGEKVVSVFGSAADRAKYLIATGGYQQKPGRQKTNLTSENSELDRLYAHVRQLRESAKATGNELKLVHAELETKHPRDWLLRLELLEFTELPADVKKSLRAKLDLIAKESIDKTEMISRGLALL